MGQRLFRHIGLTEPEIHNTTEKSDTGDTALARRARHGVARRETRIADLHQGSRRAGGEGGAVRRCEMWGMCIWR